MNPNITRFLTPIFERAASNQQSSKNAALNLPAVEMLLAVTKAQSSTKKPPKIPLEFNGKDYVSFLLHINAGIEHGLMIQYLYAAYSLGGSQVPKEFQEKVRSWQEIILGIAKEEMGHFISVQNILRLIGASLNFGREDYPWDTPFYPFPFALEPLTINSLAKYVFAESPEGWIDSEDDDAKEIKKIVKSQTSDPHLVGALFEVMLELIKDSEVISDDAFQSHTYPYQAKFDEWGRGYRGGNRGNATGTEMKGSPDVLVMPLTCRDDAYNALQQIAEQGEAPDLEGNAGSASHFERFLFIYKEMKTVNATSWSPSRNVAVNPYITDATNDPNSLPSEDQISDTKQDAITNPEAKLWGHLFNLRYRMLLNYLYHSFLLDDGLNSSGVKAPRGAIINATFGEMYNLRSIANILVQTPLSNHSDKMAGPPFTIPYTLELPNGEHNRWRMHQDLLIASKKNIVELLHISAENNHQYLYSLRETDKKFIQQIDELTSPVVF